MGRTTSRAAVADGAGNVGPGVDVTGEVDVGWGSGTNALVGVGVAVPGRSI
jgi:hypothetical protein